jgi:hypothetical protein
MHFDGSDVGLTTAAEDIDAFAFRSDGSILVSTLGTYNVTGAGGATLSGGGQDILRFVPTSLGDLTAGEWSVYLDGSDVSLTTTNENIDAIAELPDGRLLISTTGAIKTSDGNGADEDIFAFTPTSLGENTAGAWSQYFDGSDVGLTANNAEDVTGLFVVETGALPTLYLTTAGNFSVSGASGANEDIFAFQLTALGSTTAGSFGPGIVLDGSLNGLSSFALDGIHMGPLPAPLIAARNTVFESVYAEPPMLAAITVEESKPVEKEARVPVEKTRSEETSDKHETTNAKKNSKSSKRKSAAPDCGCSSGEDKSYRPLKGKLAKKIGRNRQ